ncbi:hypothetical protein BGZ61DRAFT_353005 [Ilyonectria robusta]|uniref:uncharacterized protein n=1 Tax=Ilyonectria robusta TaxID=1079257 RepID=UPI001E8E00F6|nr:uncharacterized protein BGZ61DRAFT_353005 [Ilyonectria robusta]KAH8688278.1 hypothetical protein BGZ61DRAFT_353005 [Ilyonectria robusta]
MSAKLQHEAAWEAGLLAFISRQFIQTVPPIPKSVNFSGKTALITGSNAGLGFNCARQLLGLNLSHLILAVRSQSKGDAAAKTLQGQFPSAKIEVSLVDMSSYKSIVAFAKRCEALPRLDIAILNAALDRITYERSEETKHEVTFQVNYLSTALLALLLLPILKSKRETESPAYLSLIGSDAAYWVDWKDPSCQSAFEVADNAAEFESFNAYKTSKLLLLMFVDKLSQHVPADQVVINVPNPGACNGTEFTDDHPFELKRFLFGLMIGMMARPVEVGARQYVHAVTTYGAESHGGFVSDGRLSVFPPIMYEESVRSLQETLWRETLKELEFVDPSSILETWSS